MTVDGIGGTPHELRLEREHAGIWSRTRLVCSCGAVGPWVAWPSHLREWLHLTEHGLEVPKS